MARAGTITFHRLGKASGASSRTLLDPNHGQDLRTLESLLFGEKYTDMLVRARTAIRFADKPNNSALLLIRHTSNHSTRRGRGPHGGHLLAVLHHLF